MSNEITYRTILAALRKDESHEWIDAHLTFDPFDDVIHGTSAQYVKHELDWYLSQDLSIIGHAGIENNPIWKQCAAPNGNVNSNYGWCILSDNNFNQYNHAISALLNNPSTRQSCCYYTRPSIHNECADDVHAHYDMTCTIYTQHFIRNDVLIYIVSMRSNDAWHGLRNDLEWHKYVYNMMYTALKDKYPVKPGSIHWNAGSLHLYDRDLSKVDQFLSSQ